MRSMLFVPADSERKFAKALTSNADVLILDLEDSVAPERKAAARAACADAILASNTAKGIVVRINALDTADALLDLAAVVRARPLGIMLPKCRGAADLKQVGDYLSALEVRDGVEPRSIGLFPVATETGAAMFGLGTYAPLPTPRLKGLLWGGEDLSADIGATANRDAEGRYAPTYELARTLCLLASAAAAVAPIDAVFTDFRDHKTLRAEAEVAARDGFTGKAAIHPDQVDVINEVFTPSAAQVDFANRVRAAFDTASGAGVASLDGKMLDRPHLRAALRVLARAGAPGA